MSVHVHMYAHPCLRMHVYGQVCNRKQYIAYLNEDTRMEDTNGRGVVSFVSRKWCPSYKIARMCFACHPVVWQPFAAYQMIPHHDLVPSMLMSAFRFENMRAIAKNLVPHLPASGEISGKVQEIYKLKVAYNVTVIGHVYVIARLPYCVNTCARVCARAHVCMCACMHAYAITWLRYCVIVLLCGYYCVIMCVSAHVHMHGCMRECMRTHACMRAYAIV